MRAEAKSLRFLGEGKKLTVPFFQRHYVWNQDNWEELLESFYQTDIMPYLGSIILKKDYSNETTIIDGQQRLTTVTLLAKALYDSLSEASKEPGSGIRNGIENYLFYRNNSADNFKDSYVRIEHSKLDRDDYNRVICSQMLHPDDVIDIDLINEESSNILRCYKYFRERLKESSEDDLKKLFNSLFDEERKVFVLIELQHGYINEQTIFDTINRAGVRLSTAEIIKNNIFKRMLEANGTGEDQKQKVYDAYKKYWEDVFYPSLEITNLWDKQRVFGNVKHNNLEFLLYCVACIKWGETGDMFSKLENVFEKQIRSMGYNELCVLISEIKEYAIIFKKYVLDLAESLNVDPTNEYFKYNDGVRRLMLILQKFGVQMFYPFVLKRLKETNQNDNDPNLLKDFQILESFVMRRKVTGKGTTDYTSKCYHIIKEGIGFLIESDLAKPDSNISDNAIKTSLSSVTDDIAKMVLFWVELHRRNDPRYDENALDYMFTLEHIMPKKWERNWKDVPIVIENKVVNADSEEGIQYRKARIESIGNKTLLTRALNSSLKNAAFMDKINGIGTKHGYKIHTSLHITKEIVDQSENDPVWDEAHIFKRESKIFDEFLCMWPTYKDYLNETASAEATLEASATNSILEGFTDEQLADPVQLVNAINT